jgi:hypothetical protein
MMQFFYAAIVLLFSVTTVLADDQSDKIKQLEDRIKQLETQQYKSNNYQQNYTPSPNSMSSVFIRGPRGGCYTLSSSGRKRYVDRSLCN